MSYNIKELKEQIKGCVGKEIHIETTYNNGREAVRDISGHCFARGKIKTGTEEFNDILLMTKDDESKFNIELILKEGRMLNLLSPSSVPEYQNGISKFECEGETIYENQEIVGCQDCYARVVSDVFDKESYKMLYKEFEEDERAEAFDKARYYEEELEDTPEQ